MIIDICICTYKREEISHTLRSINKIVVDPSWDINLLVVDNEENPAAKERVLALSKELIFPVRYVHAPHSNISLARNACLANSRGHLVAFLDDDETVTPQWLQSLVKRFVETGADAVAGPASAVYLSSAPQWIKQTNMHSYKPVFVKGRILSCSTQNVLINLKSTYFIDRQFKLELGQTGGEDRTYFGDAVQDGATIEFATDALVYEGIPENRATLSWLLKRKQRIGQTYGNWLKAQTVQSPIQDMKKITIMGCKIFFCLGCSMFFFWSKKHFFSWYLRAVMHFGIAQGFISGRVLKEYSNA